MAGDSDNKSPPPPLVAEFLRTLTEPLEVIRELKDLKIIPENIPNIPKIIVVGDNGAGKSSLITNLTGFNFPPNVKVPFVLNFVLDSSPNPEMCIRYQSKHDVMDTKIDRDYIGAHILELMNKVQKENKETSDAFLTLTIPHRELAGVRIVDLPGEHSFSSGVHRQKEQSEIIKGYVLQHQEEEEQECMFLHVISAEHESNSCQSAKVLKDLDPSGRRTVTVVTKMDFCTEDRLIEFTYNETNTPFGYAFVQNNRQAKIPQDTISDYFPNILKTRFGFDRVSRAIALALLYIMFQPSSLICKKVDASLKTSVKMLKQYERVFNTIGEALPSIVSILGSLQLSLYKIFISREYCEYRKNKEMRAPKRLFEKFESFYRDLMKFKNNDKEPFLLDELKKLGEQRFYCPKKLILSTVLNDDLGERIERISPLVDKHVTNAWDYIEMVVFRVLADNASGPKQLLFSLRNTAGNEIQRLKTEFRREFLNMLEMEKVILFTCDPEYKSKCEEFESIDFDAFMDFNKKSVHIKGLGDVEIGHLKTYSKEKLKMAFDMKMCLMAYWEVISKRFVDNFGIKLMSLVEKMADGGLVSIMIKPYVKVGESGKKFPEEEESSEEVLFEREVLKKKIEYLAQVKEDTQKWKKGTLVY